MRLAIATVVVCVPGSACLSALCRCAASVTAVDSNFKVVRLVSAENPETSPVTDVDCKFKYVRPVSAENPETSPVTDVDCKFKYVKLVRTL